MAPPLCLRGLALQRLRATPARGPLRNSAAPAPTRNITITSVDPSDPRVLDLGYARNRLALCANCTLTLRGVAVARDRKGNGGGIDFIVAAPWARVLLESSLRLRTACIDASTTVNLLHAVALTGHESAAVQDATFRGRVYPSSFHGIDAGTRVDRVKVDGEWAGGFDVVGCSPALARGGDRERRRKFGRRSPQLQAHAFKGLHRAAGGPARRRTHIDDALRRRPLRRQVLSNTTRLCERDVDKACLAVNTPDACVAELVDAVQRGQNLSYAAADGAGPRSQGAGRGPEAAVPKGKPPKMRHPAR
jgi:hypothetical protein